MKKINWPVIIVMSMMIFIGIVLILWGLTVVADALDTPEEAKICDAYIPHPEIEESYVDFIDLNESEKIAAALVMAIGTDKEKEVWGFDVSELIRIIANEGGDYYDVCYGVATCCFNAQVKTGNKFDPIDICKACQYDLEYRNKSQLSYENARLAVITVYAYGILDETVGDATIFYAPNYSGFSGYHESQIFIKEIHGVRFFSER